MGYIYIALYIHLQPICLSQGAIWEKLRSEGIKFIKGQVHPTRKIQSLYTHPHVNGKSGEGLQSTKYILTFRAKQSYSILHHKWTRWGINNKLQRKSITWLHIRHNQSLQKPWDPKLMWKDIITPLTSSRATATTSDTVNTYSFCSAAEVYWYPY